MGRNKIKIEKIESERKRTATYTKRSHGLIKKAMELSILCDCEVSLFIFANDKLVVYSSKDVKDTLIKFVEFKSNYFSYSNADYPTICHSTSIPEDLSEQRAVGGTGGMNDPPNSMSKESSMMPEKVAVPPNRPLIPGSMPQSMMPQSHMSSAPPDFYGEQSRRHPQAYMYESSRGVPGGDMMSDYGHAGDPVYGYPPYRGYGGPSSYQHYKSDQSKFKPMGDVKHMDMGGDTNAQAPPKKPPE
ncbi:Myocyte-specific enhancer factor 2A [Entamoeba marina]